LGWNLIERFSEDIDFLFISETGMGTKQKKNFFQGIRDLVSTFEGLKYLENGPNIGGNEHRTA
jgi:hypothetical protein